MEDSCGYLEARYSRIPCLRLATVGNADEFKKLVETSASKALLVNYAYSKSGDTPLLLAARHGHVLMLQLLLGLGADIEHKNFDGKRALHEACFSGSLECVDILLSYGANVDVLKHGDWTPLMIACTHGYVSIVKRLIVSGADLARVNKDGWNAFHLSVRENHVKVAQFLMSVNESSWKNTSKNGRTPLHTACMHNSLEVVKLLLTVASYETDQEDACGTTPLMDAFRFGNTEVAELVLQKHGADIHHRDKLGKHCLHIAAQSGALRSIQSLLDDYFIDVNLISVPTLLQAVHVAAKEGHVEVLKVLLQHGADINSLDLYRRTPLHLAAAANKIDAVRYIVLQCPGSNISCRDINGLTAIDLAQTAACRKLLM